MAKSRLLLVAFLDNIHVYNIVKNVLTYSEYDITAYCLEGSVNTIKKEFMLYYQSQGITIVSGPDLSKGRVRYMGRAYSILRSLGRFDVMQLHYVSHYVTLPIYLLRRLYRRIVISFWGSDIKRTNSLIRAFQRPVIRVCDKASFTNKDLYESFKITFGHSILPESKVSVVGLGFMFLDSIERIKLQKGFNKECRARFGFSLSSCIVTIGYHGRRAMQQLEVVSSIINVLKEEKGRIELVLPVRGMEHSIRSEISRILDSAGVHYHLFQDYIPDEDIPYFRLCSDVFINAQTTDACSASMLEYVCSGTIVINASWLTYSSLDRKGVYYLKFGTFDELNSIFHKTLQNIDIEKKRCENNSQKYNAISWEQKRHVWLSLLS